MDKVNFIHTEVGTDIIISLSFDEDTEFGIDGFTIIRTQNLNSLCYHMKREPVLIGMKKLTPGRLLKRSFVKVMK